MSKIGIILLLSTLAVSLFGGCAQTENKVPYFTRLDTSGTCGVAPFRVDFYAIASGGDPLDNPTGANLYLKINWDFDDGVTTSGSSIVYHTFDAPGNYAVLVRVEDADGDVAHNTVDITVRADTLDVWAVSDPETAATTADTVDFNVLAEACGFIPESGDYNRFLYRWEFDNAASSVALVRSPRVVFDAADVGIRQAIVTIKDVALDIVRKDSLWIEISEP